MISHIENWNMQSSNEFSEVKFSPVAQSLLAFCNPMDCSTPGFPVHHQHLELTQTHVHWVSDSIQPSHPLSTPSPPAFHLSQHQGLFKWVSSSHQVAKVLELQLRHHSFQWIFNPEGNQSWIFTGRADAQTETPILWPPDANNWLFGKDPDAGKDWRQEE